MSLRGNVPRFQPPRRNDYATSEGDEEWTSMKLPRRRRPPTATKTTSSSAAPAQDWNSHLSPLRAREPSPDSVIPRHSCKTSPKTAGAVASHSRSSSAETVIRREVSQKMAVPRIVELESDSGPKTINGEKLGRPSVDTRNEAPSPKIQKTAFTITSGHPRSKSSTSSDKLIRPGTPYPSIAKAKSTPAILKSQPTHRTIESEKNVEFKGSMNSKENAATKPYLSKTLHPPTVSDIKAAFHTLRNERNPPKGRVSDIKSVFNTMRAGTLRPPKEPTSKSNSTPDLEKTEHVQPREQQGGPKAKPGPDVLRTDNPPIPSQPSTTKSIRPATPHPDSAQAHTVRRSTTVRLSVAERNLAATLLHNATAPIDDSILRMPDVTAAPRGRTEQEHQAIASLDRANHHHGIFPSPPRATTPFAEPYGCHTLNAMPAYYEEAETNNFAAVTASHRPSDRTTIDVYGLPCGHRSVRLDPIEPEYALVFNKEGSVCARILVGEGHLVAYKHCPFVYIEDGFGRRERVDVSCEGTFVLDQSEGLVREGLVREEGGVDLWYADYIDPRTGKENGKGIMKRGWKACKDWMGTVKGTVRGTFKGTVKVKDGRND